MEETKVKTADEIRAEIQNEIKTCDNLPAVAKPSMGERMAKRLGITEDGDVPDALKIFQNDEDPALFLQQELGATKELLEIAHGVYRINPSNSNAKSVSLLSEAIKEILRDMREYRSPEELKNQIVNEVIIPLIKRFMEALNQEISKERQSLYDLAKPEYRPVIDDILKRAVSEAGLLSEHIYKEQIQRLSTLLGCL